MRPTTGKRRFAAVAAAATAIVLTLGACSSDGDSAGGETTSTPAPTIATTAPAGQTIVEIAAANPDFSTLVSAVQAAGLAETLSGDGPFTVFAPTNEAFAALPSGTLDTLLQPANKDQLAAVLTYHAVPGKVMAADVQPGAIDTVNGAPVTASTEGGEVVLTDGRGGQARVVATDIAAENGVIHVIDAVMLPPEA